MIDYSSGSGSGSYFGKVLIPIPALVPVPDPDPNLFCTVFQQQKFVQNLAISMLNAALFPRNLGSNFCF